MSLMNISKSCAQNADVLCIIPARYSLHFFSVQTGKISAENRIHDLDIKDMRFSKDDTHFITASGDRTSKIVDAQDLQVMKEFAFERPANAADMSPIADHVSDTVIEVSKSI